MSAPTIAETILHMLAPVAARRLVEVVQQSRTVEKPRRPDPPGSGFDLLGADLR